VFVDGVIEIEEHPIHGLSGSLVSSGAVAQPDKKMHRKVATNPARRTSAPRD
jgi:hypothetical protein